MENIPIIVGFLIWFALIFLWHRKNSRVKEGEQAPSAIVWVLGGAFFAGWVGWLTGVLITSGFFAFLFMFILSLFAFQWILSSARF